MDIGVAQIYFRQNYSPQGYPRQIEFSEIFSSLLVVKDDLVSEYSSTKYCVNLDELLRVFDLPNLFLHMWLCVRLYQHLPSGCRGAATQIIRCQDPIISNYRNPKMILYDPFCR